MRVLVTRARDGAEETAALLKARGHQPVLAPLSTVRWNAGGEIPLQGFQAVLVTSANGIRALAMRTGKLDIPVLAVGARTAHVARALGFTDVSSADGDAEALARLARARLLPGALPLLHVAGGNAGDLLSEALAEFNVEREILYDVIRETELPSPATEALRNEALDAAIFFSPGSARIFRELVAKSELAAACHRLIAGCISPAAAAALSPLGFAQTRIAAKPDQESLLSLLS